jgi:glycosyltransferase involved in cell wall biosynthesis
MFIPKVSQKVKHFSYITNAFGGTEYMGRGFEQKILPIMPKLDNYLCVIAPGIVPPSEEMFNSDKPILFWMHNTSEQFGQEAKEVLSDSRFIDNLKYLIVVSEYHKQNVIDTTKIPADKIYVIPNAIEPLEYKPKALDKIKIINTSSPERGIDILFNAIPLIEGDFELDIFSRFNPDEFPEYVPDSRINFYGFSHKPVVRKHYEAAHIHAYPSTYPETFCISQVEAMSAGLLCVTSDLGALPEVSNGLTQMYSLPLTQEEHVYLFAEQLKQAIETIKSGSFDPTAQIEYVNNTYSWEAIKQKWIEFHELL